MTRNEAEDLISKLLKQFLDMRKPPKIVELSGTRMEDGGWTYPQIGDSSIMEEYISTRETVIKKMTEK